VKPIYRAHVKAALDREVPRRFAGFAPLTLKLTKEERKQATLFAGSCLYGRDTPEGRQFLHFIPHRRQEQLLAEVGWSVSGQFPIALSSHGPLEKPADEMPEPEWLIDFGSLYHRKHGRGFTGWDVWTCSASFDHPDFLKIFAAEDLLPVSDQQAHDLANAAVAACLDDVNDVALPYLDQWQKHDQR
jgi:hypothetical protein